MRSRSLIIIFLCGLLVNVTAQDYQKDMESLFKTWMGSAYFTFSVKVSICEDVRRPKETSVESGIMQKSGNAYYSSFLGDETVAEKGMLLMVDNSEKTITYFEGDEDKNQASGPAGIPIDSLKKYSRFVVFVDSTATTNHYAVKSTLMGFSKVNIYYDKQTKFLKKVSYEYSINEEYSADAAKVSSVEIIYYNVKTASTQQPVSSSVSKYIVKRNGKWIVTPMYSGYELEDGFESEED